MQIIPVIDIKDGVVVHAIAGQRDEYEPIQSQLACDATPGQVAAALHDHTGCSLFYLADLSAIAGATPDWAAYDAIATTGASLMIDAGLSAPDSARDFMTQAESLGYIDGVVIALEALTSCDDLSELQQITNDRGIFSLDLQAGQLLTHVEALRQRSPLEMGQHAIRAGFQRLIVLDLAQVGVSGGVSTHHLCRALSVRFPGVKFISGGGVRHRDDLDQLQAAGCHGALVASALHNRTLSLEPPDTH